MSPVAARPRRPEIEYPDSDGQPMAENTLQFEWIVTIKGGMDELFRDNPDVFVAGDLLWYPVEGNNRLRVAPDVLVAFGRPKGYRGSYKQWVEDNLAPQVVFEVLSPGNRVAEMIDKFRFYERHGVEEYYVYDPDEGVLTAWIRDNGELRKIDEPIGWTSPRLGVRFEMEGVDLRIIRPDGRVFANYLDLCSQRDAAQKQADAAQKQADAAQKQADAAQKQADAAQLKTERLIVQLKAAGIEPEL